MAMSEENIKAAAAARGINYQTTADKNKTDDRVLFEDIANNAMNFKINPDRSFVLPTETEMLTEGISEDFAKKVAESLGNQASAKDALFYVDNTLYSDKPGYYPEAKVAILRATPIVPGLGDKENQEWGERALRNNEFDGDTIYFNLGSVDDGGSPVSVNGKDYGRFTEYLMGNLPMNELNKERFGLRFLGINSPEITHYTIIPKTDSLEHGRFKLSEVLADRSGKFIYDRTRKRSGSGELLFIKSSYKQYTETWNEVVDENYTDSRTVASQAAALKTAKELGYKSDKITYYQIVSSDESLPSAGYQAAGKMAQAAVLEVLTGASDILVMIDQKTINRKSGEFPAPYNDDYFMNPWNFLAHPFDGIARIWENLFGKAGYRYLGYNGYGQDAYKRWLGTIFVKKKVKEMGDAYVWINVSKYVLQKVREGNVILPDYKSDSMQIKDSGYNADAFKLWSYNTQSEKIVDLISEVSQSDFDDRRAIQKELAGTDFANLRDYTVMLGDCLFMIPPTSIRVVTQTSSERVPLLRARGSMTKGSPKSERMIEMRLYFNNEAGINGIPLQRTLRSGENVTYYMNGLRQIVSMFKLTPFLPIENHYLNDVLNIEAVTLANMQISTVPGYPRLLAAVLTMEEFNYHMYMPEIPIPTNEDGSDRDINMFSRLIDYEVMRWHYQRPILKGEKIKGLEVNSADYVKETLGNRTALQPMEFKDPGIEFYVVNKEYLDQQKQLKIEAMKSPLKTQNVVSEGAKSWAKQAAIVYQKIMAAVSANEFQNLLKSMSRAESDTRPTVGVGGSFSPYSSGGPNDPVIIQSAGSNKLMYTSTGRINDKTNAQTNYLAETGQIYAYLNRLVGPAVYDMKMTEKITEKSGVYTATWYLDFGIESADLTSSVDLNNFVKIAAAEINMQPDLFWVDGRVRTSISATFKKEKGSTYPFMTNRYGFDTSALGMQFMRRCAVAYGLNDATDEDFEKVESSVWDGLASENMQDTLTGNKQAIDVETVNSLTFDKYDIGQVDIKSISCVFGNTVSKMSLKALDGYAPQYCGGQDTVIEVSIETRDENVINKLNLLPRLAAQYARDYRIVLPCWPIRIDSELTRMMGVNEVLMESVDINTVEGLPGMYAINLRMTSVDRTVRNKEALKNLDVANNAGAITSQTVDDVALKTYFDLNNVLSRAEIYPDLELPTIDELYNAGFRFMRYSNIGATSYPDPDFYFVYAHALGSEIIKNAIINYMKESPSFQMVDKYGSTVTIKSKYQEGLEVTSSNDAAKEQAKMQSSVKSLVDLSLRRRAEMLEITNGGGDNTKALDVVKQMEIYNTWDIAPDVRCMFREAKYNRVMKEDDPVAKGLNARIEEIVAFIDDELSKPIARIGKTPKWNASSFIKSINSNGKQSEELYKRIKKIVKDEEIGFKKLAGMFEFSDIEDETLFRILMAAADAASGEMEYEDKENKKDWQARMFINPESVNGSEKIGTGKYDSPLVPYVRVSSNVQAEVGRFFATSLQEAVEKGVSFGPFQIKTYGRKEIEAITGEALETPGSQFFLDPYYRNASAEQIQEYKLWISMDMYTTAIAFYRNMLVWIKKMIQDGVLLSVFEMVQEETLANLKDNTKISYGSGADIAANYYSQQQSVSVTDKEIKDRYDEITKDMTDEQKEAFDALRKDAEKNASANAKADDEIAKRVRDLIKEGQGPLATGKFFVGAIMALTSGDQNLYSLMKSRNYDQLNQITKGAQVPNSGAIPVLRKFILACSGRDMYELKEIGSGSETVSELLGTIANETVAIEAAEDPSQYILHSFYDMIMNDKRGRMVRAFPSYYMVFVDEGREIGLWKLHDNFYNMSAISEIQVTKSRKIAADTARIVMTNMFKTFTTDDEDTRELSLDSDTLKNYQYTLNDAWNSIFSPRTYFLKEELKRLETLPVERAQLKPGVRIHVRMGYGSDASKLPILFNGVIAEVGTGEVVEIVAQGDGIELSNPILSTSDAEDVQHEDDFVIGKIFKNWLTRGATPRNILGSLLTSKGGWLKKKIYSWTDGRFFNNNPYGIVHFGEPLYQDIFSSGEVVQNIYEGSSKPSWGNDKLQSMIAAEYELDDAPRLSTQIFGKSFWDIMHICRGASPDYIASVVPFGMRSSVFFGAPRFYYAYEYVRERANVKAIASLDTQIETLEKQKASLQNQLDTATGDNVAIRALNQIKEVEKTIADKKSELASLNADTSSLVKEKRKPFQQYHVYTSYGDIVGNTIKASAKDVKTCAVGLYQSKGFMGNTSIQRVGPLWVDFDIYPERQRTMTVDTQLMAKGTAILGDIIPYFNWVQNQLADGEGNIQGGYEIAWRMTATALKDSVKDMYQGELIVIGDPTVKPYDKMWIEDIYERMQGCAEVEAVVHNFNVAEGFTTSIYPDCIATIDDRQEQIAQQIGAAAVGRAVGAYGVVAGTSYLFASRSRPFLRLLAGYASKAENVASGAVRNVANLLGKDELVNNERFLKGVMPQVMEATGFNPAAYRYNQYLQLLGSADDTLRGFNAGTRTLAEAASYYDNLAKVMNQIDPKDLITTMQGSLDSLPESKKAIMREAISNLDNQGTNLKTLYSKMSVANSGLDELSQAVKTAMAQHPPDTETYRILQGASQVFDEFAANGTMRSTDDLTRLSNALKVAGANVENINETAAAAKVVARTGTIMGETKAAMGVVDDVAKEIRASKKIAGAAKLAMGFGSATLTGVALSMALELGITYIVSQFAYEYIERWMKNLQVLQVFPLKRDGTVMTAGLNGSKGLVVGSPTYEDVGITDEYIAKIFGPHENNFYNVVVDLFASTDMKEIAKRSYKRVGVPDPETYVGQETIVQDIMKSIAADEMKLQNEGYTSMLLMNRIDSFQNGSSAFKQFAIKNAQTVAVNTDVQENMVPLQTNVSLKEAMDRGYVQLMHMSGENTITFTIEGKPVTLNVVSSGSGAKKIIDIPMVRPDALFLIQKIKEKVEALYRVDSQHWDDQNKIMEHPIIIHSALRAGDITSWACTGFGFRIQVVDTDLKAILDEIKVEQAEVFVASGDVTKEYFSTLKVKNDTFDIMVYPPKDGYPSK